MAVKRPTASQNSTSASLCWKQHPLRTEEDPFLLSLYKKGKDICTQKRALRPLNLTSEYQNFLSFFRATARFGEILSTFRPSNLLFIVRIMINNNNPNNSSWVLDPVDGRITLPQKSFWLTSPSFFKFTHFFLFPISQKRQTSTFILYFLGRNTFLCFYSSGVRAWREGRVSPAIVSEAFMTFCRLLRSASAYVISISVTSAAHQI